MIADDLLREGRAPEALAKLQDAVRKDPSNAKYRIFLFQLLAVLGQWDRALTQLNVVGDLDPGALAMVQTYREALSCEVFRKQVFEGQRSPLIFGEPPEWIALLIEALNLGAEGRYPQSQRARAEAFETAPATSGTLNGQAFEWIADADPRLGPVLEAIVNGRYYWIPFDRIRQIDVEVPEDLRDFVWLPAHFMWSNGGEAFGFIPTRYPGTEDSGDDQLLMARKTVWEEREADLFLGLGQRTLATEADEFSLMDVRELRLSVEGEDSSASASAS